MPALNRREAKRRAKIAVLTMLEETASEWFGGAGNTTGQDHEDCVTQALANNEVKDDLARRWRFQRTTG